MKIRIASSIALAAGLMLGATGCGLLAPQATLEKYAPSDGIDVNVGALQLRNVMLIEDETGENFNVVYSVINNTGAPAELTMSFQGEGSQSAAAEFIVPEGITEFGHPDAEIAPVLVTVDGLKAGATVNTYFQFAGADEVQYNVPVLNGVLAEYRDYVLPADFADSTDAVEEDGTTSPDSDKAEEAQDVTSGD